MLKKINRLLKFIGLNLVHAKSPKAKIARRAKAYVAGACVPSADCCVEKYDDCKTHYVGDGCKPAHVDASPTQDNNVTGPTS